MNALPHIVIVGGGFGGLYAARALGDAPVRVTLADRHNYHLFQPLLYQVAAAVLNPADIAAPIRHILRHQANTDVVLGEAVSVDTDRKRLVLTQGEIAFDYLILAAGATHSYFNHPEWARFAPGLKTIEDALEIRRRVLLAFETAERQEDAAARAAWMTFVIVGAGPTGVELAGAFSEIARQSLRGDFRHIDPASARIILLEGADRVLPPYLPSLSASAKRQLEELGAEVRLDARVIGIDDSGVTLAKADGASPHLETHIDARTVIWAAGVAASPLAQSLHVPLDKAGRVLVEPDLTIPHHPDIYVIGDLAARIEDEVMVPGVAPAAIQEGKHAAQNILNTLLGKARAPFHYNDKGSLATIGRSAAVAQIGKLKLTGFVAWLAWLVIHIFFLIGFRNRFVVVFDWAWSYLTYQRGARLITGAHSMPLIAPPPTEPPASQPPS